MKMHLILQVLLPCILALLLFRKVMWDGAEALANHSGKKVAADGGEGTEAGNGSTGEPDSPFTLTVECLGADKKPLPGVEIELRSGDNVVRKGTSGDDGAVTFQAPKGKYTVVPVHVPPQYFIPLDSPRSIILDRIHLFISFQFSHTGALTVEPVHTGTREVLSDAAYELVQVETDQIYQGQWDHGVYAFRDLPTGVYWLRETRHPKGYLPMEEERNLFIPPDETCREEIEYTKASRLRVLVTTLEGIGVQGVTFRLYRGGGVQVGEATSDEIGYLSFPGLAERIYRLEQAVPAKGFSSVRKPRYVEVDRESYEFITVLCEPDP